MLHGNRVENLTLLEMELTMGRTLFGLRRRGWTAILVQQIIGRLEILTFAIRYEPATHLWSATYPKDSPMNNRRSPSMSRRGYPVNELGQE